MSENLEKKLQDLYRVDVVDSQKFVKVAAQKQWVRTRRIKMLSASLIAACVGIGVSLGSLELDPNKVSPTFAQKVIVILPTSGEVRIGEMSGKVESPKKLGALTSFSSPIDTVEKSIYMLDLNLPGFESCGWRINVIRKSDSVVILESKEKTGDSISSLQLPESRMRIGAYKTVADCLSNTGEALAELSLNFKLKEVAK
jgi:hypothetical protein